MTVGNRTNRENAWTDRDRTLLRENYRKLGAKGVARLLCTPRTVRAIYREVERMKEAEEWQDCAHVAVALGLRARTPWSAEKAASFFQARGVATRAGGRPRVAIADVRRWIATHPPEFDMNRVDRDWFLRTMVRE
jgi:hypothetical protein